MKSITLLLRSDQAAATWQILQTCVKLLISTPLFLLVWWLLIRFIL